MEDSHGRFVWREMAEREAPQGRDPIDLDHLDGWSCGGTTESVGRNDGSRAQLDLCVVTYQMQIASHNAGHEEQLDAGGLTGANHTFARLGEEALTLSGTYSGSDLWGPHT